MDHGRNYRLPLKRPVKPAGAQHDKRREKIRKKMALPKEVMLPQTKKQTSVYLLEKITTISKISD